MRVGRLVELLDTQRVTIHDMHVFRTHWLRASLLYALYNSVIARDEHISVILCFDGVYRPTGMKVEQTVACFLLYIFVFVENGSVVMTGESYARPVSALYWTQRTSVSVFALRSHVYTITLRQTTWATVYDALMVTIKPGKYWHTQTIKHLPQGQQFNA